jgi:hypothetical protein
MLQREIRQQHACSSGRGCEPELTETQLRLLLRGQSQMQWRAPLHTVHVSSTSFISLLAIPILAESAVRSAQLPPLMPFQSRHFQMLFRAMHALNARTSSMLTLTLLLGSSLCVLQTTGGGTLSASSHLSASLALAAREMLKLCTAVAATAATTTAMLPGAAVVQECLSSVI